MLVNSIITYSFLLSTMSIYTQYDIALTKMPFRARMTVYIDKYGPDQRTTVRSGFMICRAVNRS